MNVLSLLRAVCVLGVTTFVANAAPTALPRSSPESQGISSAAILAFVEAADRMDTMNSIMLLRHGHVIAEGWWAPYDAGSRHELYSLSKSFTSTAVGFAVAEGSYPCFGLVDSHGGRVSYDQGTYERREAGRWTEALRRGVQTLGGGAVAAGRQVSNPLAVPVARSVRPPQLGRRAGRMEEWRRAESASRSVVR